MEVRMRRCLLSCSLAALAVLPGAEPTAEEVEILELMNRFRADPQGEVDRWGGKPEGWVAQGVDWAMFVKEMQALKPAPPLVFDLAALQSARSHSTYMIHNGLGHNEQKGKQGYTGDSFSARMKAAGCTAAAGGENCYRDAPSALGSHIGFIIDTGPGGPGGMQPGRGHRMNMINPGYTVVGPGAMPHSGRLSVTHNFGRGKNRAAGGVVYTDANRNGRFDAGEGRGGVAIRTADGKASTRTWASGGYVLSLPSAGEVVLVAGDDAQGYRQSFPAGKDNVAFSWNVPPQADLDRADALLAAVGDASGDPAADARLFRKLVDLHLATRGLALDPARQDKIKGLVAPVAPGIAAAQQAVTAALAGGDAKALAAVLEAPQRTYRGTAFATWLDEAEQVGKAATAVANMEKAGAEAARRDVQKLHELLTQAASSLSAAEFRARMNTLAGTVAARLQRM
jgi:Cysteine-rich secretory protein family